MLERKYKIGVEIWRRNLGLQLSDLDLSEVHWRMPLKGFKKCVIAGCDIDSETRRLALKNKAVNFIYEEAGDAIENSDVVFFCTYPDSIHKIIEINAHRFKTGAVISDVCGVKSSVSESICSVLPEGVDYVGGHPMAGKEVDGFVNASSELFG